MPLTPSDKAAISGLSRANVEQTAAGLKRFLRQSLWIGRTNHYAINIVDRLNSAEPATPVRQRNLAQYISASVVLHSNDGWSYLGRAVACLIAGDTHRGLHLAYYAELRAAMSLLASVGIGIFNRKHYILPTANTIRKLQSRDGTHVLAWSALEHWSQSPDSGTLFARLVRPEGRTLDEWFHPYGGAITIIPQAKAWFMQWGMDLMLAIRDREARNQSSYRPDGIPHIWNVPAGSALNFVRETWAALEPSSTSSFELIDRHILRLALERHYLGLTGNQASGTDPLFRAHVDKALNAQGLAKSTEARLRLFLLRNSDTNDLAIFRLSAKAPNNTGDDPFAVLSRALLLLRIATGSAHDLLVASGINSAAISFWWTKIGEARGLWQPGSPPNALSDLWADIEYALLEAAELEADQPSAFSSTRSVAFDTAGRFNILSSHERVGLWGLCPA